MINRLWRDRRTIVTTTRGPRNAASRTVDNLHATARAARSRGTAKATPLDIDRNQLLDAFERRPLDVSHKLTEHPRLEIESVAVLAEGLPEASVEHNLGTLPIVDPDAVEQSAMPSGEIAKTIEASGRG